MQSNPVQKRTTKEGFFSRSNNDFMLIFTLEIASLTFVILRG